MSQEHNIEIQKAVRVSSAIEKSGVLISVGLTLLAIAIADGWPQLILALVGGYWIVNIIRTAADYQEIRHYGLFEPTTQRELKSQQEAEGAGNTYGE